MILCTRRQILGSALCAVLPLTKGQPASQDTAGSSGPLTKGQPATLDNATPTTGIPPKNPPTGNHQTTQPDPFLIFQVERERWADLVTHVGRFRWQ
jgi:hypothetical protein